MNPFFREQYGLSVLLLPQVTESLQQGAVSTMRRTTSIAFTFLRLSFAFVQHRVRNLLVATEWAFG